MAEFLLLKTPPVEEMALGVTFSPLEKLTGPFFGIFWQEIAGDYPNFQTRPTAPAQIETHSSPFDQRQGPVVLSVGGLTELPQRYLFNDKDHLHLLQLQRDLISRSWRRQSAAQSYPGYSVLRDHFEADWMRFLRFADKFSFGPVLPLQCEATYVNLIAKGDGWRTLADLPNVTPPWCGCTAKHTNMPPPDAVVFQAHYPVSDANGRLVVSLSPGKRTWDSAESLILTISARVLLTDTAVPSSILDFLNKAHDWSRKGFDAFIAEELRDTWEKGR
ncbi:MAG TPA: TIGR04255 family protein [Humisphaera sp.]|nr:TIGR04255 family protein [Humisphaera sp.]